jgi:hypothetical protein
MEVPRTFAPTGPLDVAAGCPPKILVLHSLTFVLVLVTSTMSNLAHVGDAFRMRTGRAERVRCFRAASQAAPERLRASC